MDIALMKQERIMHPVILSTITEKDMKYAPVTSFEQIIADDGKNGRGRDKNKYRVRFSIDALQNNKAGENIKLFNADTEATKDNTVKAPAKGFKRVFQMQLYAKDPSVEHNQYVKLLYYTHGMDEKKATELFGVSPNEVTASKEEAATLENKLKKLQNFNVWLDAVVERTPSGFLMLRDTALTVQ